MVEGRNNLYQLLAYMTGIADKIRSFRNVQLYYVDIDFMYS